jgi:DNA polymerase I-like protein with 3'-5' exonuclease and polymerase domains
MRYIFDIEADALKATKIHCLSYAEEDGCIITLHSYRDIKAFFSEPDLELVGHNIIKYDIPTLENILEIKINARLIDTLPISWYLYPDRMKHGLEEWGVEFNVPKPVITDWVNLSAEEYANRCSEDVKINRLLWLKQKRYLWTLYEQNKEKLDEFINYLSFKMDCLREQEELGLAFNKELAQTTLNSLEKEKEKRIEELKAGMPKIAVKVTKTVPKIMYKANGELSARGKEWLKLLEQKELPAHTAEIEVIKEWEDPNPNSSDQIKKWLYSLGWVPEHIKHVRDKKKNEVRKIPQIASKNGGGEICESVKKLIEKEPSLNALAGLSVISHRIGIFKAFLSCEDGGRLYATAMGLTNTLRMQHVLPIVNLPSAERAYGKEVRSCIIANDGCLLVGSDLSGIEDSTKRHYIYKYDPKYVEEMSTEGFDPHLDIAMLAGFLTQEQVDAHKAGKENYKYIRQKAKTVNFSATYKVGAETLSRDSGLSLKDSKRILKIYWERNHSILKVEQELIVKQVEGQKWQQNPVNGFWYSLRAEKDRFSTLNQGTAVYVFDVWIMYLRNRGIKIAMQYHDEILFNVKENKKEYINQVIGEAMDEVNNRLKLNVKIGCSADWGYDYASVH